MDSVVPLVYWPDAGKPYTIQHRADAREHMCVGAQR